MTREISENDDAFEERADFISDNELINATAESEFFQSIRGKLVERGAKLVVGPRGCGKTHIMRATWLACKSDQKLPMAVYVSFTRYYRLEPLLKQQTNAIDLFHSWVLCKIVLSTYELNDILGNKLSIGNERIDELALLASQLERGNSLDSEQLELASSLSIIKTTELLTKLMELLGRKRVVVFLDDAALSLTPDYLVEFFDIFRSLKTNRVSPKASVYPGTTEYGPRFHVRHDAEAITAWISVEDSNYENVMREVGDLRFRTETNIPDHVKELLMYASFGIPRVYLTMLRAYTLEAGSTAQSKFNVVVQTQNSQMFAEYKSLIAKLPQFGKIISCGEMLFHEIVDQSKQVNLGLADGSEKQTIIGIEESDFELPYVHRMFLLLVEAGLLFQLPSVAHGDERTYRRFIPHYASLIEARVFSAGSRGFSATSIVEFIRRRSKKHPLRRKLSTLVDAEKISALSLDLPACVNCGVERLSDSQKFCHNCGNELIEESTFKRCMKIQIDDVPGIPLWQKDQIKEKSSLVTIGDLLGTQDPASELSKGRLIGPVRSRNIYERVQVFVDEYLS